MVTMLMEKLSTGDVIEVTTRTDEAMTALVLLATDQFVILDPCDGTTPFVLQSSELVGYRKFDG
ncbi:hypothetical protein [Ilumatobacter sp.]|uniref:hypothetical protein n=1 Tax=Ilumatobacter sp. TaxID=1967498 RepID=UPI003B5181F2